MKARQSGLLRVALGLHCVLHVVWACVSTPLAEGHGPSAYAEQGSGSREAIGNDAVGERWTSTPQENQRVQTTERSMVRIWLVQMRDVERVSKFSTHFTVRSKLRRR